MSVSSWIRSAASSLIQGALVLWGAAASGQTAPTGAAATDQPVVELRQYKIVAGRRDEFIPFFESHFVESQEALGMRLVGQFRDQDDPTRFTWIRQFPSMSSRAPALHAFYFGPVWKQYRPVANPMLDDNDDVLLLRPARPGSGFAASSTTRASGTEPGVPGVVVVTIYYLWKDPVGGFVDFFDTAMAGRIRASGLPILGTFVPEEILNDFPALPVRQTEKLFVWFTRVPNGATYERAMAQLKSDPLWKTGIEARLADFQERAAQTLRLNPTPRSTLR